MKCSGGGLLTIYIGIFINVSMLKYLEVKFHQGDVPMFAEFKSEHLGARQRQCLIKALNKKQNRNGWQWTLWEQWLVDTIWLLPHKPSIVKANRRPSAALITMWNKLRVKVQPSYSYQWNSSGPPLPQDPGVSGVTAMGTVVQSWGQQAWLRFIPQQKGVSAESETRGSDGLLKRAPSVCCLLSNPLGTENSQCCPFIQKRSKLSMSCSWGRGDLYGNQTCEIICRSLDAWTSFTIITWG